MYVALSHITSLSGMYLSNKYTNSAIKVNRAVDEDYTRIQTEQLFVPIFVNKPKEKNFKLSLLNMQPLRKHL